MTLKSQRPGVIVLAAGFGRRFGATKQLAKLANGLTVIEQTLQNIQAATSNIIVVTRIEIAPSILATGLDCCIFEDADKGMGASLAFGMSKLPDWDSVMVCLADMPFISTASYQTLLNAARIDRIIVPVVNNTVANPCVFGNRFFDSLSRLEGDKGGRGIINRNPEAVIQLAMDDAGLLQDIDTEDDLLIANRATGAGTRADCK